MNSCERRKALEEAGFELRCPLHRVIITRLAGEQLTIDADNCVRCLLRLGTLFRILKQLDPRTLGPPSSTRSLGLFFRALKFYLICLKTSRESKSAKDEPSTEKLFIWILKLWERLLKLIFRAANNDTVYLRKQNFQVSECHYCDDQSKRFVCYYTKYK